MVYGVAAAVAAFARHDASDAVPWAAVCLSATALAGAAAARRPMVLLPAAHAGLCAAWAGTVAARLSPGAHLALLLGLGAGMGALVVHGLDGAPRAAAPPPR